MSYFDLKNWRVATQEEVLQAFDVSRAKPDRRKGTIQSRRKRGKSRSALVFRELLSPFDIYSYLKARFGEPNGMQSMMIHKIKMVRDDSSNIFHWDYHVISPEGGIIFTGAAREVHVWLDREFSDDEWLKFASALKADFGTYGQDKSKIVKSWQKWHIFPNRYLAIANRCSELQSDLDDAVQAIESGIQDAPEPRFKKKFKEWSARREEITSKVINSATQLSILTPVLFESFLGLLVAVFLKPEIRRNVRVSEAFKRSALDIKLYELEAKCSGFAKPISESNEVMRRYWNVVNERNDVIHGNVDPIADALEIVYFEGNKPIHRSGADVFTAYFSSLLKQYKPEKVLSDYHCAHEMIAEVLNHMVPAYKQATMRLMNDPQPGWDADRLKFGLLFSDHLASMYLESLRYDADLKPT
jgi:hypothetical protein